MGLLDEFRKGISDIGQGIRDKLAEISSPELVAQRAQEKAQRQRESQFASLSPENQQIYSTFLSLVQNAPLDQWKVTERGAGQFLGFERDRSIEHEGKIYRISESRDAYVSTRATYPNTYFSRTTDAVVSDLAESQFVIFSSCPRLVDDLCAALDHRQELSSAQMPTK